MKLIGILLLLLLIGCSNADKKDSQKVYTKVTVIAGTTGKDGVFREQYRQEYIEDGEVYLIDDDIKISKGI